MKPITMLALMASFACSGTATSRVELPASQWVLAELNGEPVAAVGERGAGYLRFEGGSDRFAASAGCNSMAGRWRSAEDALGFSDVISTLMACEEPLMTRERALSQALSTTTRYRTRDGRLELLAGSTVVASFTAGSGE